MTVDINQLYTYSAKSLDTLEGFLREHPEALTQPFETLSKYKCIAQLMAHCIGAEQRWTVSGLMGQPRPPRYEETFTADLDILCADAREVRDQTLAELEAGELSHEISYTGASSPMSMLITRGEIMFHIINHETWHRGQISMALQRMQLDPPNFDYPLLMNIRD